MLNEKDSVHSDLVFISHPNRIKNTRLLARWGTFIPTSFSCSNFRHQDRFLGFDKLPDLILDNPKLDWRNFYKCQVIRLNDRYYYVFRNQEWTIDRQDPWRNPFKVYGLDYQAGIYYKKGSYVQKDGHLFQAYSEGSSNRVPQINGNPHIWTDLGSIEALTWRKDRIPKDDTPIYWKGKLYLKNEDFVENIEPGTGKGYNLYNELAFDPYTIYERYFWRDEWQRPVVVYQNKVYTLIAETNKKAGNYI